jgi:hypothetical protein
MISSIISFRFLIRRIRKYRSLNTDPLFTDTLFNLFDFYICQRISFLFSNLSVTEPIYMALKKLYSLKNKLETWILKPSYEYISCPQSITSRKAVHR